MISRSVRHVTVAALLLTAIGLFAPHRGYAQTFSLFYSFTSHQAAPFGVIRDAAGSLYGTTEFGGLNGTGTIYTLSPDGRETVLYQFGPSPDASSPGTLMRGSDGNLYGTSVGGGAFGYGTIFRYGPGGERILYSFTGGSDGGSPSSSGVVQDAEGNLYGTTTDGTGTVFKLNSSGELTTLHTFTGGSDGNLPWSGVIVDAAGNVYGTTEFGGASNSGTVFKLNPAGVETVLINFNGTDGYRPYGRLIRDAEGNFFSTTWAGGTYGCGTVFKLNKYDEESVIYNFGTAPDGCNPIYGVVRDSLGNFYGTTAWGGNIGGAGYGVVFMLKEDGTESVLYNFSGFQNYGAGQASGNLVVDPAGNLYGSTLAGGQNCGCGTIFKVTP
ncbi:MAG TPA: choice-of-anchor tandem repeat GloVer-containing protein [Candidatus Binatia bacterium]|nr:choice-of-anchor tandem repeat GloVer-containing protein [Candidatus Binatia bacterium]